MERRVFSRVYCARVIYLSCCRSGSRPRGASVAVSDRACPRASAGPGSGPAGGARQRSPAAWPPNDPSCANQGEGPWPSPSLRFTPRRQGDRRRTPWVRWPHLRRTARRGVSAARRAARGAQSPRGCLLPVKRCALHHSPEFFASSANAKPGPRRWRFGFLRGESIKLRFTNPPHSGTQSRHR